MDLDTKIEMLTDLCLKDFSSRASRDHEERMAALSRSIANSKASIAADKAATEAIEARTRIHQFLTACWKIPRVARCMVPPDDDSVESLVENARTMVKICRHIGITDMDLIVGYELAGVPLPESDGEQ